MPKLLVQNDELLIHILLLYCQKGEDFIDDLARNLIRGFFRVASVCARRH